MKNTWMRMTEFMSALTEEMEGSAVLKYTWLQVMPIRKSQLAEVF